MTFLLSIKRGGKIQQLELEGEIFLIGITVLDPIGLQHLGTSYKVDLNFLNYAESYNRSSL